MTEAEKYLERIQQEHHLSRILIDDAIKHDIVFVMESYKDHCISSISDEMIEKEFKETKYWPGLDKNLLIQGAKWFKEQLLNKNS